MRAAGVAVLGLAVVLVPAVVVAAAADTGEPASLRIHEVRRGDTLDALARRYGVTVAAIVTANRLPSARALLRIGQRLTIPPATATTARAPRTTRVSTRPVVEVPPHDLVLAVPDFEDVRAPFTWPVEGPVTSAFGRRRRSWHRGIDIKAAAGTPVLAAAAGVVTVSGVEGRYGQVVKIDHDDGFVTVYAHNELNLVDVGDRVAAGETIALVGRTGRATADHLHFEIRRESRVYNPLYFLPLPPIIARLDEDAAEDDDE